MKMNSWNENELLKWNWTPEMKMNSLALLNSWNGNELLKWKWTPEMKMNSWNEKQLLKSKATPEMKSNSSNVTMSVWTTLCDLRWKIERSLRGHLQVHVLLRSRHIRLTHPQHGTATVPVRQVIHHAGTLKDIGSGSLSKAKIGYFTGRDNLQLG